MVHKTKIRLIMKRQILTLTIALSAIFSLNAQSGQWDGTDFDMGEERIDVIQDAVMANAHPKWGKTPDDSARHIELVSVNEQDFKQLDKNATFEDYKPLLATWRILFFNAPAARQTTFLNGAKAYSQAIKELKGAEDEESKALQSAYFDTLMAIYQTRRDIFPEFEGSILERSTLLYFSYRNDELPAIMDMFERTYELRGNEMYFTLIYPWVQGAWVLSKKDTTYTTEYILSVYNRISEVADHNIENESKYADYYAQYKEKATQLVISEGILSCASIVEIYKEKLAEKPGDPELLKKAYGIMLSLNCHKDTLYAADFLNIAQELLKVDPTAARARYVANSYSTKKDYNTAIGFYQQASELEEDASKKAQDLISIAGIYQRQGNFSKSRETALQAAELRPDWGEPYIQIANLYLNSGKLCGPGTGWDSQVVVWPAIDMLQKAKSVDPEVSEKAQSLINKYWGFMPTKEDIFFKNLSIGGSYTVPCWINRTTSIRASDG